MQSEATMKLPVSEAALLLRVRRKLAKDFIQFSKNRTPGNGNDRYYSTDNGNVCNPGGDDLERIGRDVGVLKEWEELA